VNIVSLTAATGTSIVRSLTQVNHGEINTLAAAIVVIPACQILVFFGARSMMIFLEGTDTGLVKLWSANLIQVQVHQGGPLSRERLEKGLLANSPTDFFPRAQETELVHPRYGSSSGAQPPQRPRIPAQGA
jgi:hypothetical protein